MVNLGVKRTGRGADHPRSSVAGVRLWLQLYAYNTYAPARHVTFHSPVRLHGAHNDIFTFSLPKVSENSQPCPYLDTPCTDGCLSLMDARVFRPCVKVTKYGLALTFHYGWWPSTNSKLCNLINGSTAVIHAASKIRN